MKKFFASTLNHNEKVSAKVEQTNKDVVKSNGINNIY